jgi:hypothetical protein
MYEWIDAIRSAITFSVGAPYNFVHNTHVEEDQQKKKLVGLPAEWEKEIHQSVVRRIDILSNNFSKSSQKEDVADLASSEIKDQA